MGWEGTGAGAGMGGGWGAVLELVEGGLVALDLHEEEEVLAVDVALVLL